MVYVGHTILLTGTVLGFGVKLDNDTSVFLGFVVVLKGNCFPAARNLYPYLKSNTDLVT